MYKRRNFEDKKLKLLEQKMDERIKAKELHLFRNQLFPKIFNKNLENISKPELLAVVKRFIVLFKHYSNESVFAEENKMMKKELTFSNELINKYEQQTTIQRNRIISLKRDFKNLSTIKKSLDQSVKVLSENNVKLKEFEKKYNHKIHEEFESKTLNFKLNERTIMNRKYVTENKLLQTSLLFFQSLYDVKYFTSFRYDLKRMNYHFESILNYFRAFQNDKLTKNDRICKSLSYFIIILIELLLLNTTKVDYIKHFESSAKNAEIFTAVVGKVENLFEMCIKKLPSIEIQNVLQKVLYDMQEFYELVKKSPNPKLILPKNNEKKKKKEVVKEEIKFLYQDEKVNVNMRYEKVEVINFKILYCFVKGLRNQDFENGEIKSCLSLFNSFVENNKHNDREIVLSEYTILRDCFFTMERSKAKLVTVVWRKRILLEKFTKNMNNKLLELLYKLKTKKYHLVEEQDNLEKVEFVLLKKQFHILVGNDVKLKYLSNELKSLKKEIDSKGIELIKLRKEKELIEKKHEVLKQVKNDKESKLVKQLDVQIEKVREENDKIVEKKKRTILELKNDNRELEGKLTNLDDINLRLNELEKNRRIWRASENPGLTNVARELPNKVFLHFKTDFEKKVKREARKDVLFLQSLKSSNTNNVKKMEEVKKKVNNIKRTFHTTVLNKRVVDLSHTKFEMEKEREENVNKIVELEKKKLLPLKDEIEKFIY